VVVRERITEDLLNEMSKELAERLNELVARLSD
jgi:hypothetical protein